MYRERERERCTRDIYIGIICFLPEIPPEGHNLSNTYRIPVQRKFSDKYRIPKPIIDSCPLFRE